MMILQECKRISPKSGKRKTWGRALAEGTKSVVLDCAQDENHLHVGISQNVFHEKQMEVDRGVLVLKRDKNRLRLLEECLSAPSCDLEELRRAIMLKRVPWKHLLDKLPKHSLQTKR